MSRPELWKPSGACPPVRHVADLLGGPENKCVSFDPRCDFRVAPPPTAPTRQAMGITITRGAKKELKRKPAGATEILQKPRDRQAMNIDGQAMDRGGQAIDPESPAIDPDNQAIDRNNQAFDRDGQAFDRDDQASDHDEEDSDPDDQASDRGHDDQASDPIDIEYDEPPPMSLFEEAEAWSSRAGDRAGR